MAREGGEDREKRCKNSSVKIAKRKRKSVSPVLHTLDSPVRFSQNLAELAIQRAGFFTVNLARCYPISRHMERTGSAHI